MKRLIILLAVVLSSVSLGAESLSLCGTAWQVRQGRGHNWYPATVPGTIHTDLMAAGVIEDPYMGFGERAVQWVDKEDWIYRSVFDVPEGFIGKQVKELCFDGLDTYAEVSLNGRKILDADNMFRRWRVDVSDLLREKDNELVVKFFSPIAEGLKRWEEYEVHYRVANDQSANGGLLGKQVSVHTRKAGYHYGWDWGPRIVTSGIWRDVRIEVWNRARIADVYYHQLNVDKSLAVLEAEVEIVAAEDIPSARIRIRTEGLNAQTTAALQKGSNLVRLPLRIKHPKRWWCAGLGEQHLYSFEASLEEGGALLASRTDEVGLRSINLVREKDVDGVSFFFTVNDVPVFMKGANYIPCDLFLPRVGRAEYDRTVGDAAAVGMNMLRVWGGGIYEDDYFYHLCDKAGILIWQDFMFSCSIYPWENTLRESGILEAEDNVRRLRNHPCIAIWCGNNECCSMWYSSKTQKKIAKYDVPFGEMLNRQYYHDLPAVVEKCAPGMLYTPTSPWSPEGSKNTAPSLADVHYWIPWTKRGQTATFETYRSRFFSEYGFQSFAGIETVRQFAPDSVHWDVNSEMMMFHQRGGSFANGRMMGEMEDNYRVPRAFVDQLYLSQLVQGDVIRGAIEAHRRDKPFCWGTLVWQINDCWPVASWAGRDWYGTWKAQHYFCKYAFQDILPSTSLLDDKVGIWLVSDRLQPVSGKLEISFETFDGQVVLKQEKKVRLAANSSMKIQDFYTRELGAEPSALFVRLNFTDSKGVSYSNRRLLTSVKNAQLPACRITSSVKSVAGGYEVTVFSDRYARGVWLNVENGILRCDADGKALPGTCTASNFSDNFFDLAAGESRTVFIASELPYERFVNSLLIRDFVSATR